MDAGRRTALGFEASSPVQQEPESRPASATHWGDPTLRCGGPPVLDGLRPDCRNTTCIHHYEKMFLALGTIFLIGLRIVQGFTIIVFTSRTEDSRTKPMVSITETVVNAIETVVSVVETVVLVAETVVSVTETVVSIVETVVSVAETVVSIAETVVSVAEAVVSVAETVISIAETVVDVVETVVRNAPAIVPVSSALAFGAEKISFSLGIS